MEGMEWFRKLRRSVRGRVPEKADPTWPEWYERHFSTVVEKTPRDALLTEVPVVVIDAETTGLDHQQDRLLSLGALRVTRNTIHLNEQFEGYLPTPRQHRGKEAVTIHGILPDSDRYAYSTETDLLAGFLDFIGDHLIVGHHIGFDVEMINLALARNGAGKLRNRVVDTGRLAERLQPVGYWTPPDQFSLDKLARRYRIPLSDRHTALGDAYITAVLWLKLTGRLFDKIQRPLQVGDLWR
ncbi:MAG: 3'-5' exonuclease [Bacteroidota bacterium]